MQPVPFEKQALLIYAGTNGYLDDVPVSSIRETAAKLLDYLEKMHDDKILEKIKITGELAPETEEALKKALEEFKKL